MNASGENRSITGSMIPRLALCPGSFRAEMECNGVERATPEAEAGMRIHSAVADCFLAEKGDTEYLEPLEDPTEQQMVERYVHEGTAILNQLSMVMGVPEIHVEKRITSASLEISGKPDLVAIWTHNDVRCGLIMDWKTGWIPQEESDVNLQLRAYAVIARDAYKLERVDVALMERTGAQRTTRYENDDLNLAEAQIRNIITLALMPWASRLPGERQCRYCRAVGTASCPESIATVHDALTTIAPAPTPLPAVDKEVVQAIVPKLTGAQLSYIRERKAVLEWVLEAVDDQIKVRLTEDPSSVPGWRLKPGARRRTITNTFAAWESLKSRINLMSFMAACRVSLKDLQGQFSLLTGATRAQSEQAIDEACSGAMVLTENQPSIVRAKD